MGPPSQTRFRLGLGTVSALREAPYRQHPHVLRLTLSRGLFCRTLISFISWLSPCIQAIARSIWVTGFLPSVVIVKKCKPGWEEEFENEKTIYRRLQPLQGRLIPVFYGETFCEGRRALVLSEMPGVLACEQKPPYLDRSKFRAQIETALQELATFNMAIDDKKLHNVLLVDGGVILLDMESLWEPEPGDLEWAMDIAIKGFVDQYNDYLYDIAHP